MQELIPDLGVMHLRRGGLEAMHDAALGIAYNMRLHPEKPVIHPPMQGLFTALDQLESKSLVRERVEGQYDATGNHFEETNATQRCSIGDTN